MSTKPVVLYYIGNFIEVGSRAIISGIKDHPRLGDRDFDQEVLTSIVLKINDDGSFETENTIYKRS